MFPLFWWAINAIYALIPIPLRQYRYHQCVTAVLWDIPSLSFCLSGTGEDETGTCYHHGGIHYGRGSQCICVSGVLGQDAGGCTRGIRNCDQSIAAGEQEEKEEKMSIALNEATINRSMFYTQILNLKMVYPHSYS